MKPSLLIAVISGFAVAGRPFRFCLHSASSQSALQLTRPEGRPLYYDIMRFAYVVLAAVVAFVASTDSVVASEQAKLTSAENQLSTHLLTTEQNDQRLLRAAASDDESSFVEKLKFRYWYAMKRSPNYVYEDFFKGMDRSIIIENPNYKVWMRYEAYYEKRKAK